jgi:hypothetical protein
MNIRFLQTSMYESSDLQTIFLNLTKKLAKVLTREKSQQTTLTHGFKEAIPCIF